MASLVHNRSSHYVSVSRSAFIEIKVTLISRPHQPEEFVFDLLPSSLLPDLDIMPESDE